MNSNAEAVEALYGANDFEFLTMESLYRFLLLSSISGLKSVSRLRLDWIGLRFWQKYTPPNDSRPLEHAKSWNDICDALTAMSRLRKLTISGCVATTPANPPNTSNISFGYDTLYQILSPLSGLRDEVSFQFIVDARGVSATPDYQERLRRDGCTNVEIVYVHK